MKKLFACLLVCAMLGVICIAASEAASEAKPSLRLKTASPVREDELSGLWVCKLNGVFSYLTLADNAEATLQVGTTFYRLSWAITGSQLTLTQNGTPIQGIYSGNNIILTIADYKMVFEKATEAEATTAPGADIIGTWSCMLADGSKSTLAVDVNGNASLNVGKNTYRCTWTLTGETLTLTQNNRPLTGTYRDGQITLSFSGVKMVFDKD